jgi:uncharacterized membrane protein
MNSKSRKTSITFVDCHRIPERSFFYKGKQFPVCARCTGIYIGYISIIVFALFRTYLPAIWSIALIIPILIDGITQVFCNRESTNILRLITGIMFGIGISSLMAALAKITSNLILTLLN